MLTLLNHADGQRYPNGTSPAGVDSDAALGGIEILGNHPECRGLASTVNTQQTEAL